MAIDSSYSTPLNHDTKRFSNPFLDVASTYLPENTKELLEISRVFYYTNPIVRTVVNKFSEYGVTKLVYNHTNENVCNSWKKILEETLDILEYCVHSGLNFYSLGNHIMSIRFPTRRRFVCDTCLDHKWEELADWRYTFPNFWATCKTCNGETKHTAVDVPIKDMKRMSFISWNPEDIFINFSQEFPEKTQYFYRVPSNITGKIRRGYKHQISAIPIIYIEAVRKNRLIEICRENLFHMKRMGPAERDMGWGKPEPMAAFKKIFYAATLNKAQEAIALDRANPLDIISPASSGQFNPVKSIGMPAFEANVREQLKRHRRDVAYKATMSHPVNAQRIGGDAKALLLTPELDNAQREIAGAMDVPIDIIYGNLNWSGASVNLRMLENKFLNFRKNLIKMVKWVIERLSSYVGLPIIDIEFSKFKMADDPQQKQLAIQLYSMGLLSAKTILSEWGWDWKKEVEQRAEEEALRAVHRERVMEADANIQGRQSIISARYTGEAEHVAQSTMMNAERREQLQSARLQLESLMRQQGNRNPNIDDLVNQLSGVIVRSGQMNGPVLLEAVRSRNSNLASLIEMRLADSMSQQSQPEIGEPMTQQAQQSPNPFDPAMAQQGGKGQQMSQQPQQRPPRQV